MRKVILGKEFEEIINEYSDLITRICILNLRNCDDAKDCFQNVFIKLYLREEEFQNHEHLKAWIIRVCINECRSYRRLFYKPTVNIDKVVVSDNHDELKLLPEVLKLPNKQRNILYLHYYEGYKCEEIAELLHLNVNTVKSHLKRGREELKKRLGDFYE